MTSGTTFLPVFFATASAARAMARDCISVISG